VVLGVLFGGVVGVISIFGFGVVLKLEIIGLVVLFELLFVICDI